MSDAGGDDRSGPLGWIRWFLRTDYGPVAFLREVLGSVGAVLLIGLVLFAVSGLWPPMVAVESGSMEPNLHRGDLVFVMEEHRFSPQAAYADTGVVTHRTGNETGYTSFGRSGDVIVYKKNGRTRGTPIIHRAMFWVNESENWYDKADPDAIGGAENCRELPNCPAPHAGFVTKGDNPASNQRYDQVTQLSGPVRPEWIVGTAELRIPYLGYVRLLFGQAIAGGEPPTLSSTPWSEPATVAAPEPSSSAGPDANVAASPAHLTA
jgi:signal peptidase